MTDAEDLARRYLHLWQDYLTARMTELREPEPLELWIAACSALAGNPAPRDPAAVEQTAPSGLSDIAWEACSPSRWRCVARVKSPVLPCSPPPGIFMPKVGRIGA
jgi:hypothetical protein